MPAVKITSGKTGNQFTLNFKENPTQKDVDEALAQLEPEAVDAAPKPSPTAEQEAFEQQFIEAGTQDPLNQALSALGAPVRAGTGLAKGLAEALYKGVQGAGSIYGKAVAAGEQGGLGELLKSYYGDMTQTIGEAGPRALYETVGQGGAAGFQTLPTSAQTIRSLNAVSNPLAMALNALVNPQGAPTQARAQQAFEENALNQALAQQGEQGIAEFAQRQAGLVPAGEANIDFSRALPLGLGAEALPGAALNLATKTLPELFKQMLRTGATAATTPASSLRAARAAEPFLSGTRLAEAETGVEGAAARQAALNRALQEQAIKEQAAAREAARGITEVEGATAGKGLEAITAQRELQTAQGTITPQIVQAETSIEAAAQHPVVILGRTAEAEPVFGKSTIGVVEREMKASETGPGGYKELFTAIDKSLPEKPPSIEGRASYKAAKQSQGELSEGFEAYNKGEIKRILDESTRVTQAESKVSPLIQNLYDSGTPAGKADLLKTYPELAQGPTGGTIPKYTWNELQTRFRNLNEGISQAIKYGDTNDARILSDLKRGIIEDMETYASQVGGDTLNLFKRANAEYAAHQDKFGLNRIQTMFKDDVLQNPENVASNLIHYNNPSQVNALKAIVSPEEFIPVQAQFSNKLFSPTFDVPFDPSHFVNQYSTKGARETAKSVFGEQGLADLDRIYESSKSFAKIGDLQKTLDRLATQSEAATASFSKAKGTMTEVKRALAEKNAVKAELKATQDATKTADLASVNKGVEAAMKELDRVKSYRDLKDWATRISGLNILEAASTSPAWEQLVRYSTLHLDKYQDPSSSP